MPVAEVRAASSIPVISRKIRCVRPAAERTKRNPFGRFGDDSSEYQSFSLRTAVAGQKASTINQKPIFFFESFSGRAGRDRAGGDRIGLGGQGSGWAGRDRASRDGIGGPGGTNGGRGRPAGDRQAGQPGGRPAGAGRREAARNSAGQRETARGAYPAASSERGADFVFCTKFIIFAAELCQSCSS